MFNDSLYKFEGDPEKMTPKELMEKAEEAMSAIASLQTAQGEYNLKVSVVVGDERIPLLQAVKAVGMAGRAEKMWRGAVGKKKDAYWSRTGIPERSSDTTVASPVMGQQEIVEEAHKAALLASAFRAAIAEGNNVAIEIDWLDPLLFK